MGYVYSALNNQAEAIKAFEESEKDLGPGIMTLELAKLYDKTGNVVEAQKKYKTLADSLRGTALAAQSRNTAPEASVPQPVQGSAK